MERRDLRVASARRPSCIEVELTLKIPPLHALAFHVRMLYREYYSLALDNLMHAGRTRIRLEIFNFSLEFAVLLA
jgi:hypothetical protein